MAPSTIDCESMLPLTDEICLAEAIGDALMALIFVKTLSIRFWEIFRVKLLVFITSPSHDMLCVGIHMDFFSLQMKPDSSMDALTNCEIWAQRSLPSAAAMPSSR